MSITTLKSLFYRSKVSGDMNGLVSGYLIKKRIDALKPYVKNKKKICDIGCGIFRWQRLLASDTEYVGIDSLQSIVEYNSKYFKHNFFCLDIETADIGGIGNEFDLIIMSAVIEHFRDPLAILKKLASILKRDGQIALTTPHPRGDIILNWGARFKIFSNDKYTHNDLLDYEAIKKLAVNADYKLLEYRRFLMGLNQVAVLAR